MTRNVHGAVNAPGSSTVATYSIIAGSTRVKRSVSFSCSRVRHAAAVDADARSVREVRRLDDERVAFEAAARAAHPLANAVVERGAAVERDDASVVDHLVADRHGLRVLRDAHAVAVDDGQQRADHAARDAAVVQREVVEVVERPRAERAARLRARRRLRPPASARASGRSADRRSSTCSRTCEGRTRGARTCRR